MKLNHLAWWLHQKRLIALNVASCTASHSYTLFVGKGRDNIPHSKIQVGESLHSTLVAVLFTTQNYSLIKLILSIIGS